MVHQLCARDPIGSICKPRRQRQYFYTCVETFFVVFCKQQQIAKFSVFWRTWTLNRLFTYLFIYFDFLFSNKRHIYWFHNRTSPNALWWEILDYAVTVGWQLLTGYCSQNQLLCKLSLSFYRKTQLIYDKAIRSKVGFLNWNQSRWKISLRLNKWISTLDN